MSYIVELSADYSQAAFRATTWSLMHKDKQSIATRERILAGHKVHNGVLQYLGLKPYDGGYDGGVDVIYKGKVYGVKLLQHNGDITVDIGDYYNVTCFIGGTLLNGRIVCISHYIYSKTIIELLNRKEVRISNTKVGIGIVIKARNLCAFP